MFTRLCRETNIADMTSSQEEENPEEFQQEFFENDGIFAQDILINQSLLDQVSKTSLTLSPDEVFKSLSTISKLKNKMFCRKNYVLTCISSREYALDIKDTCGTVEIPLVNREEISAKIAKLSPEIRKTISYIHIGSIKIMIKATFRLGINSPIKLALVDRRLTNPQDAIFGAIQGNLAYGKLCFTVNPQIGVPLNTKSINSVLCLAHEFERSDLMRNGDMPFSITYKLGYSLTNSHHSMMFRPGDRISIDGIFKEIGQASSIPFQEVPPLQSIWAMNLTQQPLLGASSTLRITESQPRLRRPSHSPTPDGEENPTVVNNWTYDPQWNVGRNRLRTEDEDRALLRAQHRMSGFPPPNDNSASTHTISRRINRLSIDLANDQDA